MSIATKQRCFVINRDIKLASKNLTVTICGVKSDPIREHMTFLLRDSCRVFCPIETTSTHEHSNEGSMGSEDPPTTTTSIGVEGFVDDQLLLQVHYNNCCKTRRKKALVVTDASNVRSRKLQGRGPESGEVGREKKRKITINERVLAPYAIARTNGKLAYYILSRVPRTARYTRGRIETCT